METLAQRVLTQALYRTGNRELLARELGASMEDFRAWMDGRQVPPIEVIRKAAEIAERR